MVQKILERCVSAVRKATWCGPGCANHMRAGNLASTPRLTGQGHVPLFSMTWGRRRRDADRFAGGPLHVSCAIEMGKREHQIPWRRRPGVFDYRLLLTSANNRPAAEADRRPSFDEAIASQAGSDHWETSGGGAGWTSRGESESRGRGEFAWAKKAQKRRRSGVTSKTVPISPRLCPNRSASKCKPRRPPQNLFPHLRFYRSLSVKRAGYFSVICFPEALSAA